MTMRPEFTEYEYAIAEIPANIIGSRGGRGEASRLLKELIDDQAKDGFEFYRVDTFTTTRPAGCLGLGGRDIVTYNLVTFRRPKGKVEAMERDNLLKQAELLELKEAMERDNLLKQAELLGLKEAEAMSTRKLRHEVARMRREQSG